MSLKCGDQPPKSQRLGVSSIGQQVRSVFSFHTQKEEDGAAATYCSPEEFQLYASQPKKQLELLRLVLAELGCNDMEIRNGLVRVPSDDTTEPVFVDLAVCLDCIRVRHFRIVPAAKQLKRLVAFRAAQEWPYSYRELKHFPELKKLLATRMHTVLPGTDLNGRRLITMVCSQFSDSVASPEAFHRMATVVMHEAVAVDKTVVDKGVALIVDFRGASLKVISKFTVADMQRGVQMWLGFPLKIKCCYLIGAKLMVRTVIRIVLRSVSAAMRSKVQFVDSPEGMAEYVPDISVLPAEYGGTLPDSYASTWMEQTIAREELPCCVSQAKLDDADCVTSGGNRLDKKNPGDHSTGAETTSGVATLMAPMLGTHIA